MSVVVPTRNRSRSLATTLDALGRQTAPLHEVIVVDASDPPLDPTALGGRHAGLPLRVLASAPGVCAQRNLGVARASGSWVLLCDDDVELPPGYVEGLLAHLRSRPERGALSGLVCDVAPDGRPHDGLAPPSLRHLGAAWLFQTTVWADVEGAVAPAPLRPVLRFLQGRYRRRGNGWTRAGWPLVTQVRAPAFDTAFYGLGAALVRRDWLLASPFDERLGPHGIGDHYGVALGFPGDRPVTVLRDLRAIHHRARENRLDEAEAHLRRALALDYFVRTSGRFGAGTSAWLAWSLLGKAVLSALAGRGRAAAASLRAAVGVVSGTHELVRGGVVRMRGGASRGVEERP